jgi:hypothetical protein
MKKVSVIVLILILVGIVVYYFSDTNDTKSYTFTADIDGVSFDAATAHATYTDGWLDVKGAQRTHEGMKMIILHLHCSSTGSITLNSDNQEFGSGASYGVGKTEATIISFGTNSSHTGTVEISTLDLVGKKVSGSFDCRMEQWTRGGSGVIHVKGSFEDVPIKWFER